MNEKLEYYIFANTEQICAKSKCNNKATGILLNPNNELIGFYCFDCGIEIREALENRYRFQLESRLIARIVKRKRADKVTVKEKDKNILNLRYGIRKIGKENKVLHNALKIVEDKKVVS